MFPSTVILLYICGVTFSATNRQQNSLCDTGTNVTPNSLTDLVLFGNNQTGLALDHYLTTLSASDPELQGYQVEKVLGRVMLDSSGCDCPVRLIQMVDNSTGLLGAHIDHKFVRDGDEPDRLGESYKEGEEVIYCSQRKGGCGAVVPLYKEWNALNYDSTYSTNDTPTLFLERYPTRPLCYIWPATNSQATQSSTPISAQLSIPQPQ